MKNKAKERQRKCPQCGKKLFYATVKGRNRSEKLKKICRKCRFKEINSRPGIGKARIANRRKYVGKDNPFFGKHHTRETIKKIKKADRSYTQTKEFRKKSARLGEKNGMYGKTVYEVWVTKYGKEIANEKQKEYLKKQSIRSSGKNNPMYGKPTPNGAGGGWGGWYNGWYFRSLRELSYMITVIEVKKYKWESAEKIIIPYISYDGKQRTYRPDFLLNSSILVEIKPKKLMGTPSNILKKEAAIKYCSENNLEYRMIDVKIIEKEALIDLYKRKKIKFNRKYEKRMKKICK